MKVKCYKRYRILIWIVIVLLLFVFISNHVSKETPTFHQPAHDLSFVVGEDMNITWENMKKGADTAAADFDATVHFAVLDKTKTIEDVLEESADKGSDAWIIAPVGAIDEDLLSGKKTALFAGARVNSTSPLTYVGCNYKEMGSAVADEIIRHGNYHKNVYVVNEGKVNESIATLLQVLKTELAKADNGVQTIGLSDVETVLDKEKQPVFVALNPKVLYRMAVKLEHSQTKHPELYGLGNSRELIPYIESGVITGSVVQDDFSIGYQAVACAVKKLEHQSCRDIDTIRFSLIDHENMYSKEHEKLLFPFIR